MYYPEKKTKEISAFEQHTQYDLQKELGNYEWSMLETPNKYYDYTKKKDVIKYWRSIEFKVPFSSAVDSVNKSKIQTIYSHFQFEKKRWDGYYLYPNDVEKILLLSPNNLSPLLTKIIRSYLPYSTGWEVIETRLANGLINTLYEIWHRKDNSEIAYIFFVVCLIGNDKTCRSMAAELWIKTISEDTIDNVKIGHILGKLEEGEYATLKRFTDLIVSNMLNISKLHNRQLLILIDNMISKMNTSPIKGTKKLLELFYELRTLSTDYKILDETKAILEQWKETKSLKTIINKIEKI